MPTSRRLLLVAYHFPPIQGSTGVTRTLAFAKYLRDYGWEVAVLTVHPRAYTEIRADNLQTVPPHVRVERAWALDAQRHLSIRGRYAQFLALPDRWQSWIPGGVARGLQVVRRWQPSVMMSTYPIASAHCIGWALNKLCRIPWVVDFRDPMAQDDYPPDPRVHRWFERIERGIFGNAARVVVTARGTQDLYMQRFPEYPREHVALIPNGFDPEMFPERPAAVTHAPEPHRPLRILHSGLLYPSERNPQHLFAALAELKNEGRLGAHCVNFGFRASGNESEYQPQLQRLGLSDIVQLLPPIPYQEALREMMAVDGLMLLQASNCNQQIPAKLYEYLYASRPILGLTDPRGDTGALLHDLGITNVAPLDDTPAIKVSVLRFLEQIRAVRAPIPTPDVVMKFSRRDLTGLLANVLEGVVADAQRVEQRQPAEG